MIPGNRLHFRIDELFTVVAGKTSGLQDQLPGATPYVTATEKNNGISAYIEEEPTFDGNAITISRNGSICEVFYQPNPFSASLDDIRVLIPLNFHLNQYIAFYLCTLIKKEKFKYTYGRKFGTERIKQTKIELPVNSKKEPDWIKIEEYIKIHILQKSPKANKIISGKLDLGPIINNRTPLLPSKWKTFKYGGPDGLFDIKNGYYNKKPDHTDEGKIPFIGASEFNNGITDYYCIFDIENNHKDANSSEHDLSEKLFKGNCVTVANNGASVGYAFYQDRDFTCSHDVNVLYLKNREWNKYIALFICTLIFRERYRWDYGRKWRPSRMPDSEMKLPVNIKGEPDWNYIENYVKSLPFSRTV